MTWTKLSDDFADDCARVQLSDRAFRTHVEALIWAMRRENGGFLDVLDLRRGCEAADAKTVDELVAHGFWQLVPNKGWQIVHHLEHQPEPDLIRKRRGATAERVRRHRRRQAGMDDEDDCSNGVTERVTGTVTHLNTPSNAATERVTRDGTDRDGTGTALTAFPEETSQDESRERIRTLRARAFDVPDDIPENETRNPVGKGQRIKDRALRLIADILGQKTNEIRQIVNYEDTEYAGKLDQLVEEGLRPALAAGYSDTDVKAELRRARDAGDITEFYLPITTSDGGWTA